MNNSLLSSVPLTREPLGEGPCQDPDSKPSSLKECSIPSHADNDKCKLSVATLSELPPSEGPVTVRGGLQFILRLNTAQSSEGIKGSGL